MSIDLPKLLALDQELFNAVRLIRAGLGQLQSLGDANDFRHLPILTLANGFERLMKVILCFRELGANGRFPDAKFLPGGRDGHDLDLLLTRVKKECFLSDYVGRVAVASQDLTFLQSEELAEFVGVLSRFGKSARYYNLDVVLGRKLETGDPESEWRQLEMALVRRRPDLLAMLKAGDTTGFVGSEVGSIMVGKLERLARALARLFTIGRIGQEAQRYVGYVGCFLYLRDDQLGRVRYDPCGQRL